MKTAQPKTVDDLHMSSKEFDKIMGQVLQVSPPESGTKVKRPAKKKATHKKPRTT